MSNSVVVDLDAGFGDPVRGECKVNWFHPQVKEPVLGGEWEAKWFHPQSKDPVLGGEWKVNWFEMQEKDPVPDGFKRGSEDSWANVSKNVSKLVPKAEKTEDPGSEEVPEADENEDHGSKIHPEAEESEGGSEDQNPDDGSEEEQIEDGSGHEIAGDSCKRGWLSLSDHSNSDSESERRDGEKRFKETKTYDADAAMIELLDEKARLDSLIGNVQKKTNAIKTIVDENKNFHAECEDYKAQLKSADQALHRRKIEIGKLEIAVQDEKTKVETMVRDSEMERKKMEGDLNIARTEKMEVEREKDEFSSWLKECQVQITQVKTEKTHLSTVFEEMRREKGKLASSGLKTLRQKMELENEKTRLTSLLKDVQEEKSKLEIEKAELSSSLKNTEVQNKNLESKNAHLDSLLDEAKQNETKLESEKAKLSSSLKHAVEQKSKKEAELNVELDVVRGQKRRLDNKCNSMKSKITALRTAEERIRKQLKEEREKELCRICHKSRRDSLAFPCLHLHCCSKCINRRSKICPTCGITLSGVVRCDFRDMAST